MQLVLARLHCHITDTKILYYLNKPSCWVWYYLYLRSSSSVGKIVEMGNGDLGGLNPKGEMGSEEEKKKVQSWFSLILFSLAHVSLILVLILFLILLLKMFRSDLETTHNFFFWTKTHSYLLKMCILIWNHILGFVWALISIWVKIPHAPIWAKIPHAQHWSPRKTKQSQDANSLDFSFNWNREPKIKKARSKIKRPMSISGSHQSLS